MKPLYAEHVNEDMDVDQSFGKPEKIATLAWV